MTRLCVADPTTEPATEPAERTATDEAAAFLRAWERERLVAALRFWRGQKRRAESVALVTLLIVVPFGATEDMKAVAFLGGSLLVSTAYLLVATRRVAALRRRLNYPELYQ